MENEGDNVISLVQPRRDEEKLLNITVTGRKTIHNRAVSIGPLRFMNRIALSCACSADVL